MTENPNIYQRLHAVMQNVSYVQKEKPQGMNYSVVSHDAVTAKVRPHLVEHGIVYHPVNIVREQVGNRTEVELSVRFVNVDNPSDYVDVPAIGYGIDQQDKGCGKAVSYAVKYALLKALGLETGEDADQEEVEHNKADPSEVEEWKAEAKKCQTKEQLTQVWQSMPKELHGTMRSFFGELGGTLPHEGSQQ